MRRLPIPALCHLHPMHSLRMGVCMMRKLRSEWRLAHGDPKRRRLIFPKAA
jgi:hypothetical protein